MILLRFIWNLVCAALGFFIACVIIWALIKWPTVKPASTTATPVTNTVYVTNSVPCDSHQKLFLHGYYRGLVKGSETAKDIVGAGGSAPTLSQIQIDATNTWIEFQASGGKGLK